MILIKYSYNKYNARIISIKYKLKYRKCKLYISRLKLKDDTGQQFSKRVINYSRDSVDSYFCERD